MSSTEVISSLLPGPAVPPCIAADLWSVNPGGLLSLRLQLDASQWLLQQASMHDSTRRTQTRVISIIIPAHSSVLSLKTEVLRADTRFVVAHQKVTVNGTEFDDDQPLSALHAAAGSSTGGILITLSAEDALVDEKSRQQLVFADKLSEELEVVYCSLHAGKVCLVSAVVSVLRATWGASNKS
jgi:hypothetical protein